MILFIKFEVRDEMALLPMNYNYHLQLALYLLFVFCFHLG